MTLNTKKQNSILYTVGHSNHDIETFIDLLKENKIRCLVDVRRFPTSKKHPQFKKENLSASLAQAQIEYDWLGEQLGGFRDGGYEAFMQSRTFDEGVKKVQEIARKKTTAIMCAEQRVQACHRRFIADKLVGEGWRVVHIVALGKTHQHQGALL